MSDIEKIGQQQQTAQKVKVQQTRLLVVAGIGVLVIVLGFVLITSNKGTNAASITTNRQDLVPILGNPNAPVTITEYGAYSCTTCRAWYNTHIIDQLLQTYPDKVRFIFLDFPIITPSYDKRSAGVAQCAFDQSQDLFWKFHNALYEVALVDYSLEDLVKIGGKVGLNEDKLLACAQANTYAALVDASEARAHSLGLPGTPAFLINGTRVFGSSPDALKAAVDQAVQKL